MAQIELQEVIDYYKQQKPQIGELVDFFYKVSQLQKQYASQLPSVLPIPADSAVQKLSSGKYILEGTIGNINNEQFKKIIQGMLELLKTRGEEVTGLEKGLLGIREPIPTKLPELINRVTEKHPDLTVKEKESASYLLWQTLRVFYRKEAEKFNTIDYQQYWLKPICPVCGSGPKISRLQKSSGKRLLSCYLCGTEWSVHRIGCPFCSNTSNDTLAYFYADGNRGYRVDVCNVCRKYIKTIDENILGRKIMPALEDFITYNLDILAISEGYQNPLNFLQ